MTSHRISTALTAAALALATAACAGGEGNTPAAPAPTSATPSASPSPAPLTKQEASAAATKINLVAADLPGYTASPPDETEDAATKAAEDAFTACVGAATTEPFAEVSSDDFMKGEELPAVTISSQVAVVSDAAQVQKDLQAFQAEKANGCIATFVQQAVGEAGTGLTFSQPTVTRLTPSAQGVDGSFGFRVALAAEAQGQKIPFNFDLLAFGKDRTEVTLLVLGVGTSVPETERDALFAKLVERGTANAV